MIKKLLSALLVAFVVSGFMFAFIAVINPGGPLDRYLNGSRIRELQRLSDESSGVVTVKEANTGWHRNYVIEFANGDRMPVFHAPNSQPVPCAGERWSIEILPGVPWIRFVSRVEQ